MLPVSEPDYPNLYPIGFHPKSLDEIEEECVAPFATSSSRKEIMDGLREFIKIVSLSGYVGEIWVDGSFTTEKINPKDIDIVLICEGQAYDAGTAEFRLAIEIVNSNLKDRLKCDSYVLMKYPEDHPLHVEYIWWNAYWLNKWGFSRQEDPKGIVVVSVNGAEP